MRKGVCGSGGLGGREEEDAEDQVLPQERRPSGVLKEESTLSLIISWELHIHGNLPGSGVVNNAACCPELFHVV